MSEKLKNLRNEVPDRLSFAINAANGEELLFREYGGASGNHSEEELLCRPYGSLFMEYLNLDTAALDTIFQGMRVILMSLDAFPSLTDKFTLPDDMTGQAVDLAAQLKNISILFSCYVSEFLTIVAGFDIGHFSPEDKLLIHTFSSLEKNEAETRDRLHRFLKSIDPEFGYGRMKDVLEKVRSYVRSSLEYPSLDLQDRLKQIDPTDFMEPIRSTYRIYKGPDGKSRFLNLFEIEGNFSTFAYTYFFDFANNGTGVGKCLNCGDFFLQNGNFKALYCDRVYADGKTCKQIGASKMYQKTLKENREKADYRRAYRRLLNYRGATIPVKAFEGWKREARHKLDDFNGGVISSQEFYDWLKSSEQELRNG